MGGKGSGRQPKFHDEYHRVQRELMRPYDREIAAIRKEKKRSFKEAQRTRRKRRRKK